MKEENSVETGVTRQNTVSLAIMRSQKLANGLMMRLLQGRGEGNFRKSIALLERIVIKRNSSRAPFPRPEKLNDLDSFQFLRILILKT
jgi:hypothetical protein